MAEARREIQEVFNVVFHGEHAAMALALLVVLVVLVVLNCSAWDGPKDRTSYHDDVDEDE